MNTKPTKEELRGMLDEGMTLYQISRRYDNTVKEVHNWLVEYDIILAWAKESPSKEDLESMYIGERMTQQQIADEIGCSQMYVCNMMDRYHIQTRVNGKFTPHQRASKADEIEQMYNGGMSQIQIAKELGYTILFVHTILHERGVQIRPGGKYTPVDEITQEYNNGKTQKEIAEEFGYSQVYVGRILIEHSIPTRVSNGTITHQEMSLITADKIQECIDKGMNQHQIAEHFNIHDATLYKLTKKFGISGMVNNYRCSTPEHIAWRDEVLDRDNYTCQLCGSQERPEVHHIYPFRDYPERQFDVDNGVVLCHLCHQKLTGHESEYIVELEDIVLRDRHIGDDIKPGIDYIDYLSKKFDQKGVDIFGVELPTNEYTSIPEE